ncbi:NepR family anti-sigma factor [Cognatishimia sp. F0-27]|uniref:NepR family anti-sigma factor n=1 Tax=Cognatishimia sp. F0-27 TaxID=2816855 RepID=UPI001D0C758A|nr:NepR family anti-sigma factor [Cognatishimia sp. F0-27]MCC1493869.1 hypothetical protein [Cognatishimia sp. F0-27]
MSRLSQSQGVEQEIDKQLKRAYEDIANQELPSRFTELLDRLRSQQSGNATSEPAHDK